MSAGPMPSRRYIPMPAPADVPTTMSAPRGSHPVASARPASTPAWNAWPVRPPAPRTIPIVDIESFWSATVLCRCLAAEVLGRQAGVDLHEQSLGLRGRHTVDDELTLGDDAPALDVVDPAVQLDRSVERCRLEVPDGQSPRHPGVSARDVGHAEQLVERQRDAPAVHEPGGTLV